MDGELHVTAHEFPAFLYDLELYDPDHPDVGLLQGYLLVRVRILIAFHIVVLTHLLSVSVISSPHRARLLQATLRDQLRMAKGISIASKASRLPRSLIRPSR